MIKRYALVLFIGFFSTSHAIGSCFILELNKADEAAMRSAEIIYKLDRSVFNSITEEIFANPDYTIELQTSKDYSKILSIMVLLYIGQKHFENKNSPFDDEYFNLAQQKLEEIISADSANLAKRIINAMGAKINITKQMAEYNLIKNEEEEEEEEEVRCCDPLSWVFYV